MRTFETGATRDTDQNKYDYEGFFSPLVLERRAEYMHKHRKQADGKLRDSDNWQRGIPTSAYMKSAFRHFMKWWKAYRRHDSAAIEEAIVALMFNCEGYLHELLREKDHYAKLSDSNIVGRVVPALHTTIPAHSSEQLGDRPVGSLDPPNVHLRD